MFEWSLEQVNDVELSFVINFNEIREYTIGRRRDCDIASQNRLVSRNHGIISVKYDGKLYVKDLKSANGTYINDKKITPLKDYLLIKNDILGIGAPSTAIEKEKEMFKVIFKIKPTEPTEDIVFLPNNPDNIFGEPNVDNNIILKLDVAHNEINKDQGENNAYSGENKLDFLRPQLNVKSVNILDSENKTYSNEMNYHATNEVYSTARNHIEGEFCNEIKIHVDVSVGDSTEVSKTSTSLVNKVENNISETKKSLSDSNIENEAKYLKCRSTEELNKEQVQSINSFTQNDDDDDIIILSDEDIFPKSQIFGDIVVKNEPVEEKCPAILKCTSPSSDNDNVNDNIFSEIVKNEEQDYDYNENDDDDDCIIWFQKLSQSQEVVFCAQERNKESISESPDEVDNNDFPDFDDHDSDIFEKVGEKPSDEDLRENRIVHGTSSDVSDNEHLTSEEVLQNKDQVLNKKKDESKKLYVIPPIIDAPILKEARKRKKHEETKNKEISSKGKKIKSSNDEISTSGQGTTTHQVNKSREKRYKRRRLSTETLTKNEKQKIQEDRKKKLKELASKNIESKGNKKEEMIKSHTKPKVKNSNSRGLFLTNLDQKKEYERKNKSDTCHEEESALKKKYKIPKITNLLSNESSTSSTSKINNTIVNKINKDKGKEKILKEKQTTLNKTKQKEKEHNVDTITHRDNHVNSILVLLPENSKRTQKRVTFKDEPEIRYIESRPGIRRKVNSKDAPIPTFVKNVREGDEILSTILEWRPAWLEEQKRINNSPQVSKQIPVRMTSHFNTARDYANTVTPLMLLELWKSVFKDWCNSTASIKLACIENIQQNQDGLFLNCYCMEDKDDRNNYPWRGDLLVAEFYLADTNIKTAKKFGYVVNNNRQKMGKNDVVHKQFSELGRISEFKLSFTMIIKNLQVKILNDKLMRIRLVSRIAPQMRVFRSISHLFKSPLCKFILSPRIKEYRITNQIQMTSAIEDKLNADQMICVYEAYQICTRDEPGIYLIQGPPGTGKSYVIKNIIRQLLFDKNLKKCRVLLCAPSNGAIDEITKTLLDMRSKLNKNERFNMIRLGPPGAISNQIVKAITLPELVRKHMQIQQLNNIKSSNQMNEEQNFLIQKINTLENKISTFKVRNQDTSLDEQKLQKAKQDLYKLKTNNNLELSFLEKKKLERNIEMCYIEKAQIICTTLSSCVGSRMEELFAEKKLEFTCCIVDEATQSCEQEALIPLSLGITKFVLVGDPQQLPSTTISHEAKQLGYGTSLFERIQNCLDYFPDNPIRMLTEQYRMNSEICKFPSTLFYGGRLKTSEELLSRTRSILHPCRLFSLNNDMNYTEGEYLNKTEADLVLLLTEIILRKTKYNIGIITPYTKQRNHFINRLKNMRSKENDDDKQNSRVTINTVDGFQGQEKDVIIISSVRYKANGFLDDRQRLNVALTRAKQALFICAHANLFQNKSVWQELEKDAKNRNYFYPLKERDATDEKYMTELIIQQ